MSRPEGYPMLRSVVRNHIWPVRERFEIVHASFPGLREHGIAPGASSTDGIYAYRDRRYALENHDRFCYRGSLLGRVDLWGVVQRHEFGYRAQFAYPVSLAYGICCICKGTIALKSDPFAMCWTALYLAEDFCVNGILCEACNSKYCSFDMASGRRHILGLADRYGIVID